MVNDLVKNAPPDVHQVTSLRTIYDAFNLSPVANTLISEEYNFMRLYLTIPITSATLEQSFSALRCLKTYLRNTMKQDQLNSSMLVKFYFQSPHFLLCSAAAGKLQHLVFSTLIHGLLCFTLGVIN